ncbi:LytR family transcriptional regulator, partial [Streptomyces galbus]|nr:LytR family transcriptional regulator [Streptomyces galbus]
MTRHEEQGEGGGRDGRRGRRPVLWKAAGLTLAGALVLGLAAAGWAYRHLDDNITGVDIDGALGDDRPARAVT